MAPGVGGKVKLNVATGAGAATVDRLTHPDRVNEYGSVTVGPNPFGHVLPAYELAEGMENAVMPEPLSRAVCNPDLADEAEEVSRNAMSAL